MHFAAQGVMAGAYDIAVAAGDYDPLRMKASACSRATQTLLESASGIIHGSTITVDQDQIDVFLGL